MAQTQSLEELRGQVSQMLDRLDADTPIGSTVVFQVLKANEETFEQNASVLTDATRRLTGCKNFGFHRHKSILPDAPPARAVQYLIYEEWESSKLFRAQWDSQHLKNFQNTVLELLSAAPQLDFYTGTVGGKLLRVFRTGQDRCWAANGDPIDSNDTGQDGEYREGLAAPSPRFSDNGKGSVTDKLTGLVWLQNADAFGEVTWENALANARSLASGREGLNDGSHAGEWRLPNIRELLSLIDYGASDPIIPVGHPFKNVKSAIYWTSTTLAPAPILAWMMTLGIGPTVFDVKRSPNPRMWPVRGQGSVPVTGQKQCWDTNGNPVASAGTGQDGELQAGATFSGSRFKDNGDGTITDNMTGLVWLKNADPFGLRTWQDSLDLCNSLANGSAGLSDGSVAGDWRLPNIREAESLVDYNNFGPCLPTGHPFVNLRPSSYWTSTSVTSAPTEAMFIIYGVGPSIFESKEHSFFVWPVRNKRLA